MRCMVWLMLALALVGCSASPMKMDVHNLHESESVIIHDSRPASESELETFSYLVTSDAYGIYRVNHDATDPSPLRLFQHMAFDAISPDEDAVEIKVHHFVIYSNMRKALKAQAAGSVFGLIGAAVATSMMNHEADFSFTVMDQNEFEEYFSGEEYLRGVYSEEENPNDASIFIIYIDAEVNGVRRFIRSVYPLVATDESQPLEMALKDTIKAFLALY